MIENTIYITVDVDWAADDILEYALQRLEQANVAATFFATHSTPVLDRIRQNPNFELGVHPNFNPILFGDAESGESVHTIMHKIMAIIPEAKSVRSHALAQGSPFSATFSEFNLVYDCNPFIPACAELTLKPWQFRNGMISVPFIWSDYMHCAYDWPWQVEQFLNAPGLKVFAFHPIHLALNTVDLVIYQQHKHEFNRLHDALKFRHNDSQSGAENFLDNLLARAMERGFETKKISEIDLTENSG